MQIAPYTASLPRLDVKSNLIDRISLYRTIADTPITSLGNSSIRIASLASNWIAPGSHNIELNCLVLAIQFDAVFQYTLIVDHTACIDETNPNLNQTTAYTTESSHTGTQIYRSEPDQERVSNESRNLHIFRERWCEKAAINAWFQASSKPLTTWMISLYSLSITLELVGGPSKHGTSAA